MDYAIKCNWGDKKFRIITKTFNSVYNVNFKRGWVWERKASEFMEP